MEVASLRLTTCAASVVAALAALLGSGAAVANEQSADENRDVAFHAYANARAYPVPFDEAWEALGRAIRTLKLKIDAEDREHGFVRTKPVALLKKHHEEVRKRVRVDGFQAADVMFTVFVSPYASPTRVYVSSESNGLRDGTPVRRMQLRAFHDWLLDEFELHLNVRGSPIPFHEADRREMFAADGAIPPECADQNFGEPLFAGVGAAKPRVIPVSKLLWYPPGPRRDSKTTPNVTLEVVVQEDGFVGSVRQLRADVPDDDFGVAAATNVAAWRYEPAEVEGCRVAVKYTVHISYMYGAHRR